MLSAASQSVGIRARAYYAANLKAKLEATDWDNFVAVGPDSGEYFVAVSMDAAVDQAQRRFPNRLTHVIRIGNKAA